MKLRLISSVSATVAVLGALAGPAHAGAKESIVQFQPGVSDGAGRAAVERAGGRVTRDLHLIHAVGAALDRAAAQQLSHDPAVAQVGAAARVRSQSVRHVEDRNVATSYGLSVAASKLWNDGDALTGKGIGVAVIDTGIAGNLPDFQVSDSDASSRVVAAVVTNPEATTATDTYGHGTHVAGILAGNGNNRPAGDPLRGKYVGIAPDANLISIKAGDDDGNATVIDVIYGIQFAVDHAAEYNIRVINLSMGAATAQSYKTDPLDAAVESAWFKGVVVVAAAGNRGTASDAVDYAPGNDPYVISVGAVDDKGTKDINDDDPASWGSMGVTQDGFAKPEVIAPGAHIVSTLAPESAFTRLCPQCIRDGHYFQAGGTSMATPVVSGVVALMLQKHPDWTPDQVKGALAKSARALSHGRKTMREVAADKARGEKALANQNLVPNQFVSPASGDIDYTKATWTKATWTGAADLLKATWTKATWTCACAKAPSAEVDPTKATWTKATWSTSWTK
jgi:serine protease AprX